MRPERPKKGGHLAKSDPDLGVRDEVELARLSKALGIGVGKDTPKTRCCPIRSKYHCSSRRRLSTEKSKLTVADETASERRHAIAESFLAVSAACASARLPNVGSIRAWTAAALHPLEPIVILLQTSCDSTKGHMRGYSLHTPGCARCKIKKAGNLGLKTGGRTFDGGVRETVRTTAETVARGRPAVERTRAHDRFSQR